MIKWFYNPDQSILNLISHPFYDLNIIILFLKDLLSNNKNIAYITHNKHFIINHFLENKLSLNVVHIVGLDIKSNFKDYDLVIFDDITGISKINDENLCSYINSIDSSKVLVITMRKLFRGEAIYETSNDLKLFKEPRIIQTKINLNNDMPHVLFEFIKWFMSNKTKVILITKDNESCVSIYKYMNKYKMLSDKLRSIYIDVDFNEPLEFIEKIRDDSYIYITSFGVLESIYDYTYLNPYNMDGFNIILFFASHGSLDYKFLLNICGIGNYLTNCKNEIIFVSNEENIEIIMTKVISRSYNKRLWEIGVRNY